MEGRKMYVDRTESVADQPIAEKGIAGVTMKVLIGQEQGAPNFVMRVFEIAENGHTAYHTHPWEHEVYVIEGVGAVKQGEKEYPLEQGTFVLVKPNEEHQFLNKGKGPLKFICVVPKMES